MAFTEEQMNKFEESGKYRRGFVEEGTLKGARALFAIDEKTLPSRILICDLAGTKNFENIRKGYQKYLIPINRTSYIGILGGEPGEKLWVCKKVKLELDAKKAALGGAEMLRPVVAIVTDLAFESIKKRLSDEIDNTSLERFEPAINAAIDKFDSSFEDFMTDVMSDENVLKLMEKMI